MNYRRHSNDEDLHMYYRKQLTSKEIEYLLGYIFIDPKTINYEIPSRIYELNDINSAFGKVLNFKLLKKQ